MTATEISVMQQYQQLMDGAVVSSKVLPWLATKRKLAAAKFATKSWPSPRDEAWKYTRLQGLTTQMFQFAATPCDQIPSVIGTPIAEDSHRLVFVNGYFVAKNFDSETCPGCEVGPMAQMLAKPTLLPEILDTLTAIAPESSFTALNAALWHDGLYVWIPPKVKLERPLEFCFLNTGDTANVMNHLRIVLIVGAESEVNFIEHHVGKGYQNYFTNMVTELHVSAHAKVTHTKIQQESRGATHIGTLYAVLKEHAQLNAHSVAWGGALIRSDAMIQLSEPHATVHLHGLYAPKGRNHIDHYTRIEHNAPHTTSNQYYKGILDDAARAIFNGQVIVRQTAQKADAKQQNRNLLLSRNAEIDTKPQLEIFADDVKCAHGATVGELDATALFYLRSRGLSLLEAKQLLVTGFASEIIDLVTHTETRDFITRQIKDHLYGTL